MGKVLRISLLLLLCLPLMGMQKNRALLYTKSGETMQSQGKVDEALAFFNKAVLADPKFAQAYRSRGFLYLQMGCRDLGFQDFAKVVELLPNDPNSYVTRGLAYAQFGDAAHAAADFKKGCDLGDKDSCEFFKQAVAADKATPL